MSVSKFGVEETTVTVRIGVTVSKDGRGPAGRWQAQRSGESTRPTWWRAGGHASKAEAKAEIAKQVASAVARLENSPILVIGGTFDYADCMHLITPAAFGYMVSVIRGGKHSTSWTINTEAMEDALARIIAHVGDGARIVYC